MDVWPAYICFSATGNGSERDIFCVHGNLKMQINQLKCIFNLRLPQNCSQSCNSNTAENNWFEIIETKYTNFCILFASNEKILAYYSAFTESGASQTMTANQMAQLKQ